MTTLVQAMLETAKVLGITYEGTATGGSTTTLVDSALDFPQDHFEGGTLWVTSGTADGLCVKVSAYANNTFTFATSTAVVATNTYVAATKDFPKWLLKQAALMALRFTPILKIDTTQTTVADQETYTLPTGVTDVRRVQVAASSSSPYGYETNYHWQEVNGTLYFFDPPAGGYLMRIWYVGYHGDIAESGSLEEGVSQDWLKWASAVNAWRWKMEQIRKDNPVAMDLMNEAKTLEANAERTAKRYQLKQIPRDPIHADW